MPSVAFALPVLSNHRRSQPLPRSSSPGNAVAKLVFSPPIPGIAPPLRALLCRCRARRCFAFPSLIVAFPLLFRSGPFRCKATLPFAVPRPCIRFAYQRLSFAERTSAAPSHSLTLPFHCLALPIHAFAVLCCSWLIRCASLLLRALPLHIASMHCKTKPLLALPSLLVPLPSHGKAIQCPCYPKLCLAMPLLCSSLRIGALAVRGFALPLLTMTYFFVLTCSWFPPITFPSSSSSSHTIRPIPLLRHCPIPERLP